MPIPDSIRKPFRSIACIAIFAAAGCTTGAPDDPDLASAIRQHYAAHATEEEGTCRSPKIDTIQAHRLVERTADGREEMLVRYSYFDRHADMDTDWDKLVHLSQPCGGIGERRFTLRKSPVGYKVVGMAGEHRHGAGEPNDGGSRR